MRKRLCLAPMGLAAAAVSLAGAGAAHAAPAEQVCAPTQDVQAFLAWGDPREYFLAPDGNFADSGAGWSLQGSASVVPGGDGYSLGGNPASTQSLSLPDASAATTPAICLSADTPTIRFFAENSGAPDSTLSVSATVSTHSGDSLTWPVATITASGSWSPTAPLPIASNLHRLLGHGTLTTFTFTPEGQGGQWQIDDLYVDPWTRGG